MIKDSTQDRFFCDNTKIHGNLLEAFQHFGFSEERKFSSQKIIPFFAVFVCCSPETPYTFLIFAMPFCLEIFVPTKTTSEGKFAAHFAGL